MEMRHLYADPATSPFVRYGGGYAVFPPNDVRSVFAGTLDALSSGATREEAWRRFVANAWIGGQPAIHPASTWSALFLNYVAFFDRHFPKSPIVARTALEAARIIVGDDPEPAWDKLKTFLLEHIDDISGWSSSWLRDHAEQLGVVRHEDGTYWCPEASGTLIRIHGATTLPETRLDFITDAILRPWGPIRQVLMLFAVVATSEDFRRNPSAYPTALRMEVFLESPDVSFAWHTRQHFQVRTVKWRPPSNLCDAEWLQQLMVVQVADATSRDVWAERVEVHRQRLSALEPEYKGQLDFILDTSLLIGEEDEVYLSFDGRIFRWMNGTPESRATLTVGCNNHDLQSTREAEQAADRLLSFLVWQHHMPITKLWGIGGPRRSLPMAWEPRMSGGLKVSPQHAVSRYTAPFSPRRWLALALYREGVSSRSVFYQFLSLWKVLELALPEIQQQIEWVNQNAAKLSGAPSATVPIYDYLIGSGRDAIAHVSLGVLSRRRKKKHGPPVMSTSVDPDNHEHRLRITKDTVLVRELAEKAIQTGLTD